MNLIGIVFDVLIFALVFAIGLKTRISDLGWVAREKGRAARAFVALFVVVPLTTIAACVGLGLAPAAALFLLMLSVAPLPPLFPSDMQKLGVADEAAVGLGAFAAVAALVMAPLMLWFVAEVSRIPIEVPVAAMLTPLLKQMLLPLLAGMAVAQIAPGFAAEAGSRIAKIANPLLIAAILLLLWLTRDLLLAQIAWQTIAAMLIILAVAMAGGHLLGGPLPANRAGLAMAASGRNVPFAIAASSAVLPDAMPVIAGAAILMSLLRALVAPMYTKRVQAQSQASPV
jgi:BASS family bile acid:Na+ symporter